MRWIVAVSACSAPAPEVPCGQRPAGCRHSPPKVDSGGGATLAVAGWHCCCWSVIAESENSQGATVEATVQPAPTQVGSGLDLFPERLTST